ncbi:endonuclease subunit [uncultured Caudovirales phage]|uniref:Endonuclease subunit n=1 Tax=uncultured Caudovirales phage TaxID=2100421 RepID=A0A6J7WTX1_9CAUD|nr:endonuclease subunit [uncultured Caudovirales phage]
MIYFKNIRWKNFLSTGNAFTEIRLDNTATTLIVGENGAGKSTLLDALSFVLYNKPFRKVNKPQLMNSINKKDLLVELDFVIGANTYKITRGLKPGVFEVYQNDRLLNQDATVRDYQSVLEKQILKLNHKSFCQVVVLGSASFVPFMQLTTHARREIIEDLLDIQIFSIMNALLKDKVSENAGTLTKVEHEYDMTSEKIKMQQEHLDAMQKNNEEQIEKFKSELKSYTSKIDEEKQCIEKVDLDVRALEEQIQDQDQIAKKQKKLQVLETQLNDKLAKLRNEIEFFESHDSCPTCKQGIDDTFKCETVATKQTQVVETDDGVIQIRQEIQNIQARINRISEISSQITSLNIEKITHSNTINGLLQQCKKVAKDISELQQKTEEYVTNDDKMKELEETLETLSDDKAELLRDKEALNITSRILKDDGIKAKIIKQYIPIINKLINKYLSAMDFFVNFEIDENFEEKIKSRFRDEFSYSSFSEGEKMRINLAILFTWRAIAKLRNSASTNLLIMDEVLDGSLDSNGTDEFLKIIGNLTHDTNSFIISHKGDQLVDKFSSVIKFEKHKNFSRIAA